MDPERCNEQKLHLRQFDKANEGKTVFLQHSYSCVDKTGPEYRLRGTENLHLLWQALYDFSHDPGITYMLIVLLKIISLTVIFIYRLLAQWPDSPGNYFTSSDFLDAFNIYLFIYIEPWNIHIAPWVSRDLYIPLLFLSICEFLVKLVLLRLIRPPCFPGSYIIFFYFIALRFIAVKGCISAMYRQNRRRYQTFPIYEKLLLGIYSRRSREF